MKTDIKEEIKAVDPNLPSSETKETVDTVEGIVTIIFAIFIPLYSRLSKAGSVCFTDAYKE
jgi:hypothetical protein